MSEQPEALRLAKWLDAMPSSGYALTNQAAAELRRLHEENERLKAAVQGEPVAWLYPDNLGRKIVWLGAKKPIIPRPSTAEPLYTSPPASKPWVGLTDEEYKEAEKAVWAVIAFDDTEKKANREFYEAIEAKLREKNA